MTTKTVLSFLTALYAAGVLSAADGTWKTGSGNDWSVTANWQDDTPAEGSGSTAFFPDGSGTVNNDVQNLALLGIEFAEGGWTLAGGAIALDANGFITVLGGAHTLDLPLALAGDTAVSLASGQDLALNGGLSGAGGLTVTGGRLALKAANTFTGPFTHIRGLVTFSDLAALGEDTAPVVIGEGTFRYTGVSDTLARGLTLLAGIDTATNSAAVIDIPDPGATLTVSGPILTEGGAFVKTGEGTLALTYPGYQVIGLSCPTSSPTGAIAYDADGIPPLVTFHRFTLERGTLRLGAPGQTNIIQGGWVGCLNDYSPTLEINGGYHRFIGDYLSIARGTGSYGNPQSPGITVDGGAEVILEGSGFVMDNAHYKANHVGRPWLRIDGGSSFKVTGNVFLGENGGATGTVDVVNGSLFTSDNQTSDRGMTVSPSAGADMTVTFDNASTNRAYLLRVGRGGKLTYKGDSVIELDGAPVNAIAGASTEGTVTFDNATLKQRTATRSSDWFPASHSLFVGPGDLTADVSKYAWIGPALKPSSAGGSVTKTGPGTLALATPQVPVTVAQGTLALAADTVNVKRDLTLAAPFVPVTVLPGASIQVSGVNALSAVPVSADSLILKAPTLTQYPENWAFLGSAQIGRTDGHLRITPDISNAGAGAAYLLRKQRVTGPWTATFTYRAFSQGTPADGMSFIIHNDPRGTAAIGGGGPGSGYQASTGIAGVSNSVAVGLIGYYRWLTLGQGGLWTATNTVLPSLDNGGAPHFVTVRYDGEGTLGIEIERPDRLFRHDQTYAVNLADEIGADEAFIGFGAATGGSYAAHTITDFTFENRGASSLPASVPYRLGGSFSLGADETLSVNLRPSATQSAFALGPLAYAAGAALDISSEKTDSIPTPAALPVADIADTALWKLNNAAHWLPDGSLATSTNATGAGIPTSGSAFTTNRYPVANSWTAKIGYRLGNASSTPADLFCLQLQTVSPTYCVSDQGFCLMWRYYENPIFTTQIKTLINNALLVHDTDIAPVHLANGAPVEFIVVYDAPAQTVTVTSIQNAGTNVTVITDINLTAILNASEAYVGFYSQTGGEFAENVVTDFSFTPAAFPVPPVPAIPASLAFDSYTGTGPLTVRSGTLCLPGDVTRPTADLPVRLENGTGLLLGKIALAPLDSTSGPRSDWLFSDVGSWVASNSMQFCINANYTNGTVTSTRRVRVADAWTLDFDYTWGAGMNNPADAFCMFLHNDPRGPGYSNGTTGAAGFDGMQNAWGVRWYFYPGNQDGNRNSVRLGQNGIWDGHSLAQSYEPILFYTNPLTHVTIKYDPAAQTLTAIIANDGLRSNDPNPDHEFLAVTNVFTGVDIPARVQGDYAYLGFGGATGGATAQMRASDVLFTADAPFDAMSAVDSLASLDLPAGVSGTVMLDSPVAGGTFNIPSLTLGDGAALSTVNHHVSPATLKIASAALDGTGAFDVAASAPCKAAAVTGAGPLAKRGAGVLTLTGSASYTGDTLLEAGTLALDAPHLPSSTDLHVTPDTTLNLAFIGKQYIHSLYVNGVQQPGGLYTASTAPWITGSGVLVVTYPPVGSLLILK